MKTQELMFIYYKNEQSSVKTTGVTNGVLDDQSRLISIQMSHSQIYETCFQPDLGFYGYFLGVFVSFIYILDL